MKALKLNLCRHHDLICFWNIFHQLTAKLTIGHFGPTAVQPAEVEPRPEAGELLKRQRTEELSVQLWRKRSLATLTTTSAQVIFYSYEIISGLFSWFSWLWGWRLVNVVWLQCDLRGRNKNKRKRSCSRGRERRSWLSGFGGNRALQHWPMPRLLFIPIPIFFLPKKFLFVQTALGLLLADGAPTVGREKTFWRVN